MFRTAPTPAAAPEFLDGAMIQLRGVEKSYAAGNGRTWVLRQISLDLREGEFVTVMGPSGAGKSTLLAILGLYDGDWGGSYRLLGQETAGLKPKHRGELNKRHVGFVFQKYHLLDDLTVYENLDIPLSYRDVPKRERQAIVAETLDRFGIVAKKDLYPSQLSGGQQQLVGVARAVIAKPKLLLADEPTGNLHSEQAREIMELFRRLNAGGTTVVQVTHSEENAGYGSRVIELRDGWITDDREIGG
jgi:putative ABC transport system ATP-binding protein